MKIFVKIIILIFIVLMLLTVYYISYNISSEHMVSVSPLKQKIYWNQNKCDYSLGKTMDNVLKRNNIIKSKDKWQIYFPCGYDEINNELSKMPVREGARYFIIDNSDTISAKEWLWLNVLKHHGYNKTISMLPKSYVLYLPDDIKLFDKEYNSNKIYIMKKNIQRQEGLKITKDKNEIMNGAKNGYTIVQELLENPYLIDGRKINLRFYLLFVCKGNSTDVYAFNDGFMYYTKAQYKSNSLEADVNITTGYIDRKVYEKNPLTHNDFKVYLDKPDRVLSKEEAVMKGQNLSISQVVFERINRLLRDVCMSFIGNINTMQKFKNNVMFQLFGVDVAIDNQMQAQVIEFNKGPSIDPHDERDGQLKQNVIEDAFKIVSGDNSSNGYIKILDVSDGKLNSIKW
jgi:hypothetical protein